MVRMQTVQRHKQGLSELVRAKERAGMCRIVMRRLLLGLTVLVLHAGPDQLFVRVHDAVRHCEEMRNSSAGATNGFHLDGIAGEAPLSCAAEPLLARNSMDFV